MIREPAAITGIGIVSPIGNDREAHWIAQQKGVHGIAAVERFDASSYASTLAGEVRDLDPAPALGGRLMSSTDWMTQMSLVAAAEAVADSGIAERHDPGRCGVFTASTAGGYEFGQRELQNLWSRGPKYVSAYQSYAWFYAVNTGQISIRHGFKGHSGVVVADAAGALDALASSAAHLHHGNAAMVSGAVDGTLCPWGWVAHVAGGGTTSASDPETAYLPFDPRASGAVVGEGGAHLVLERAADATGRAYALLVGHASGFVRSSQDPTTVLRRVVEAALADADVRPDRIDLVLADGAGTVAADADEAAVLRRVFGPRRVPVTVPKAAVGRLQAGGAALDVAVAALALRDGLTPPTVHSQVDPAHGIDLVAEPRAGSLDSVLVVARGRGGFVSAVVLTSPHHHPEGA